MRDLAFAAALFAFAAVPGAAPPAGGAEYQSLFGADAAAHPALRLRAGLVHQHEDFFHRAFSYQGVAGAVSLDRTFFGGLEAATFATTLATTLATPLGVEPYHVSLRKVGLFVGRIHAPSDLLHTGWSVHVSYVSLVADRDDFFAPLPGNRALHLGAFLLDPQVFLELNITRWATLRAGLSYSFHTFAARNGISRDDLNGPTLVFGVDFGRFDESP